MENRINAFEIRYYHRMKRIIKVLSRSDVTQLTTNKQIIDRIEKERW